MRETLKNSNNAGESSTGRTNGDTKDVRRAKWLWMMLSGLYGDDWTKKYGDVVLSDGSINPSTLIWSRRLAEFKKADIEQALVDVPTVIKRDFNPLPTINDLLLCCQDAKRLRIQREAESRALTATKIEVKPPTLEMQIHSQKVKIKAFIDMGMGGRALVACNDLALLESGISF